MQFPGFRICQVAVISFYAIKAHTHIALLVQNARVTSWSSPIWFNNASRHVVKNTSHLGLARQRWIAVVKKLCECLSCGKRGGSRSKTKHYHHKLGTLDFGFVLTWPTSSCSSCSTARETVACYGMKPGWSWCQSCKATASGQRWQRYKAMASGQRFKAIFGALPRASGSSWVMNILMVERPVTTLGAQCV